MNNLLLRIALYIIAAFLLLFIVLAFLNCGTANAMTEREKVRLNKIDHVTFSNQQLSVVSQAQGAGCERVEAAYSYSNYLNNVLFRYSLVGRWCYDGDKVTSVNWSAPDRYSITGYPWNLWTFKGGQTSDDTGGKGMRYAFHRNNGTFGVDIAWYHHTETVYVQCTVRGDGTSDCGKTH